jgi:hypothetical protein
MLRVHRRCPAVFVKTGASLRSGKTFRLDPRYQVGGKSIMWGGPASAGVNLNSPRLKRYGYAIDWPIRYADIAPWYSHVEKFAGICGSNDGWKLCPTGITAAI